MRPRHDLERRGSGWLRLLAAALALVMGATGCSDLGPGITSPETDASAGDDRQADTSADRVRQTQPGAALDRLAEAYTTQDVRMLGSVLHRRFHFITNDMNPELPRALRRSEVLRATNTMFAAEDVIDVRLTIDYEEPSMMSWRRRVAVMDATVTLEVTMQNVFGPPVVYLVDQHPARFVLQRRGWHPRTPWVVVSQRDLYSDGGTERTILPSTFSEVLDMFLQR